MDGPIPAKTWSEAASAPENVPALGTRPRVPRPIGMALDALWPALPDYAGRRKTVLELFGNRFSLWTLKNWRQGKRPAPAWVRETLAQLCEAKAAELAHIAALLKDEKAGR